MPDVTLTGQKQWSNIPDEGIDVAGLAATIPPAAAKCTNKIMTGISGSGDQTCIAFTIDRDCNVECVTTNWVPVVEDGYLTGFNRREVVNA